MIQPADETKRGRRHMVEFDVQEVIAALVRAYPNDLPRAQVIPERTAIGIKDNTVTVVYETIKQ